MSNLLPLLNNKLLPWAANRSQERIIIARPTMKRAQLPDSVKLAKRPLFGERKIIKRQRLYRNIRARIASWPEQGLNEVSVPKMACVISGHVDFQVGKQAILCGQGHFIFIPAGVPHPDGTRDITDLTKSDFCEVIYFYRHPDALQCWISRYAATSPALTHLGNYLLKDDSTIQLFRVLMQETVGSTPIPTALSAQLLQVFLQLFQREIQAERFQEVPNTDAVGPHSRSFQVEEDFSEQLLRYIQSHLHDRPTLESAAQEMYLSRAQFARRVREETGKTFIELLNEQRISIAQELLRDSDWTVNTIAVFIGFRTPHHLHSLFRRHLNTTPNAYRKQARKD